MEILENQNAEVEQQPQIVIDQDALDILFEQRNIWFNNDVDDEFLNQVLMSLVKWESQDLGLPIEDRMPINFFINSNGGDITTGFAIINFIQQMQTPVNMIVSKAYSMATAILLSVPLENRYMFEDATILIHEGSMELGGGLRKVTSTMKFMNEVSKRYDNMIINNTNISKDKLRKKKGDEWFIFAEKAKKLGLVGAIIGKDIMLQDIL